MRPRDMDYEGARRSALAAACRLLAGQADPKYPESNDRLLDEAIRLADGFTGYLLYGDR